MNDPLTSRGSNIIAIIPARGGSKGVPRKNIRPIAGQPLIAWSIADALESRRVNRVYVSTEDPEIKSVAVQYGAAVVDRPAELAQDTTSSEAALLQALDAIAAAQGGDPGLVVFLQATSPLRTGANIDEAIQRLEKENADSLLSVCATHAFLWEERNGIAASVNYDWLNRPRRQDMAPQYRENGSIYVFKPWVLRQGGNRLGGKIAIYPMNEESGVDIDSEADLRVADCLLRHAMEKSP